MRQRWQDYVRLGLLGLAVVAWSPSTARAQRSRRTTEAPPATDLSALRVFQYRGLFAGMTLDTLRRRLAALDDELEPCRPWTADVGFCTWRVRIAEGDAPASLSLYTFAPADRAADTTVLALSLVREDVSDLADTAVRDIMTRVWGEPSGRESPRDSVVGAAIFPTAQPGVGRTVRYVWRRLWSAPSSAGVVAEVARGSQADPSALGTPPTVVRVLLSPLDLDASVRAQRDAVSARLAARAAAAAKARADSLARLFSPR